MSDRERILIVEDEGVAALALEAKLNDIGYECAGIAFTAEEALDVSRSQNPDLILMDVQLRGSRDGIDAALAIQKELDIPVVYVTAFSDERTISRARASSPFGYLTKPLREEAIRCTVEMALSKHRLERELRQSEERFRTVFYRSRAAMALVDSDLRVELVNPAFERLFSLGVPGLTPAPLLTDLVAWPQEGLWPIPEDEVELLGKDGRWIAVTCSALQLASDSRKRMFATFKDVTERKQAELKLIQAKTAAELDSRTRRELLAHLGHEIRTPLSSMIGYSDLLSRGHVAADDKKVFVERIRSCGYQLIELVNEVLDYSKAEAGLLIVEKEVVDLIELARDVVSLLEVQAQAKSIALLFCVDGGVCSRIWTDPRRLRQILINLIGNAIKFTSEGHVAVKITAGTAIEIEVSDTGCGISEEARSSLFRPFLSADSAGSGLSGVGLGLSLSRSLAEVLGGSLSLNHSREGQGTTFTLVLPRVTTHSR